MTVLLITALLGAVGFSLIFRMNLKYLPITSVGAIVACAVFFAADRAGFDLFASNFFAAAVASLYSEICARILRAPASIFLLPCMIPLVPGGMLYYSMSHLISHDIDGFLQYGGEAAMTAVGIAGGMIAVSVVWSIIYKVIRSRRNRAERR